MPEKTNTPFALLIRIWLVFSTVINIIALASLADGLIAWNDFILRMLEAYHGIRDAIWSGVFSLFSFPQPQWAFDYLTINSIVAISILWAMTDATRAIASTKLGSALQYIVNGIASFSVGAELPARTMRDVRDQLNAAGQPMTDTQAKHFAPLAKPIVSAWTIIRAVVMTFAATATYLMCAFVFPWVIQAGDRWGTLVTNKEFKKFRSKIERIDWSQTQRPFVLGAFDRRVLQYSAFAAMDDVFHQTLQSSLYRYLITVLIFFAFLVLGNQVYISLMA